MLRFSPGRALRNWAARSGTAWRNSAARAAMTADSSREKWATGLARTGRRLMPGTSILAALQGLAQPGGVFDQPPTVESEGLSDPPSTHEPEGGGVQCWRTKDEPSRRIAARMPDRPSG